MHWVLLFMGLDSQGGVQVLNNMRQVSADGTSQFCNFGELCF